MTPKDTRPTPLTPEDVEKLADEYAVCRAEYWRSAGSTVNLRAAREALMSAIRQLCAERDEASSKLEQCELRYADLSCEYYDKSIVKRVVTDTDQRAAMETIQRLSSERDALQARVETAESLVRDMGLELARANALAIQVPVWRDLAARFSIPEFVIDDAFAQGKS